MVSEKSGVVQVHFLGDAVRLEPWFDSGYIAAPEYLPPWMQRAKGLVGVLAFSLFANSIRLEGLTEEDVVPLT